MPRYNVQNPDTGLWACFSGICDEFITDWMSKDEYEAWRRKQYGVDTEPAEACNMMDYEEAMQRRIDMVVRTFDNRLLKALKDKNITQRQLAKMTGLSESLISSYCRGTRTPRIKNALILACALGVTGEWLVFGMEEVLGADE